MLPRNAKPIQLSNFSDSDRAATFANVAGVMTPVIKFTAPRGSEFVIPAVNEVNGVPTRGMFIVLDLRDAGGNKLPPQASIEIAHKNPGQESKTIDRTIKHGLYASLDVIQQQNNDFKARVLDQLALEGGVAGIVIAEQGQFIISVESAAVIDWTKSQIVVYAGEQKPGAFQ
jgi:hypothetical protein